VLKASRRHPKTSDASPEEEWRLRRNTDTHHGGHMPTESDQAAKESSDNGDSQKIDDKLDELGVAKSKSGKDQRDQPDKEGSASSSKDLEQP
jgi:hypothetical protein